MFRFVLLLLTAVSSCVASDVTTAQNDAARTSSNSSEIYLTTANVKTSSFGKLFTRTLDGDLFAQPLYLQAVQFSGQTLNVVYVATMNNTVYAFDADTAGAGNPLWTAHLGTPDTHSGWNTPIGVLSTPVIVRNLGALYVVAATNDNGHRAFRLHALDLITGAEKFGGPALVTGQMAGTAPDGINGVVSFNADQHIQRSSLAVSGGSVYFAFAADRDHPPYHGWVFSYSFGTLQQTGIFNAASNGGGAGLWQSGRAPAVDSNGAVYYQTGNGDFDGVANFGESILKLTAGASGPLNVSDWFTPDAWQTMNTYDYDLGSSGPTLIPGTSLVIGAGKTGEVYLVNTAAMGHIAAGNSQIVQSFFATPGCPPPLAFQDCAQIMGQAFWSTAPVPTLYVWGVHDQLRAFQFSQGRFNPTPVSTGGVSAYYPGGVLAHSSYLGTSGTGIVWAITCDTPDNGFYFGPGFTGTATLHAYDALDLTRELWNSGQNQARDNLGTLASFTPPMIANGKVYAPTFSNQLVVYGLLAGPVPGDVNGDSSVTCADVAIVKSAFGKTSVQAGFDLRADVVRDGVVNVRDLAYVSQRLPGGTSCQ